MAHGPWEWPISDQCRCSQWSSSLLFPLPLAAILDAPEIYRSNPVFLRDAHAEQQLWHLPRVHLCQFDSWRVHGACTPWVQRTVFSACCADHREHSNRIFKAQNAQESAYRSEICHVRARVSKSERIQAVRAARQRSEIPGGLFSTGLLHA